MRLSLIKTLNRQDLQSKGDLPAWIDPFLQTLNSFIQPVAQALQGRLTFSDNHLGVEVAYLLTHSTELSINPHQGGLKVKGVTLVDASGQIVTGFGWNRKSNGNIGVTALFQSGAGTSATCLLQIQFG